MKVYRIKIAIKFKILEIPLRNSYHWVEINGSLPRFNHFNPEDGLLYQG